MISNQRPSYAQTASKEDLRLNSLLFNFPTEPVTFWFSKENRDNAPLTPLTLQLFPSNIETIFPESATPTPSTPPSPASRMALLPWPSTSAI